MNTQKSRCNFQSRWPLCVCCFVVPQSKRRYVSLFLRPRVLQLFMHMVLLKLFIMRYIFHIHTFVYDYIFISES